MQVHAILRHVLPCCVSVCPKPLCVAFVLRVAAIVPIAVAARPPTHLHTTTMPGAHLSSDPSALRQPKPQTSSLTLLPPLCYHLAPPPPAGPWPHE